MGSGSRQGFRGFWVSNEMLDAFRYEFLLLWVAEAVKAFGGFG
jgi:hypothetical protein